MITAYICRVDNSNACPTSAPTVDGVANISAFSIERVVFISGLMFISLMLGLLMFKHQKEKAMLKTLKDRLAEMEDQLY